ncbi:hypothetical protein IAT40_000633 [Kwoniella sp. CBS 6097]
MLYAIPARWQPSRSADIFTQQPDTSTAAPRIEGSELRLNLPPPEDQEEHLPEGGIIDPSMMSRGRRTASSAPRQTLTVDVSSTGRIDRNTWQPRPIDETDSQA